MMRHYIGLPFGRHVDGGETGAIASALENVTVEDDRGVGETSPLNPLDVEVTPEYALVDFPLAQDVSTGLNDVKRALTSTVRQWDRQHGSIDESTLLGGSVAVGTFPSPGLDLDADRDTVRERLKDASAGEQIPSPQHYYLIAYPERRLTDSEVSALQVAASRDGRRGRYAGSIDAVIDSAYLVLFDIPRPGGTYTNATGALRSFLARTPTRGDDAPHTDTDFWRDRDAGTLGEDIEAGRAVVVDQARERTDLIETGEGEVSTS